MTAYSGTFAGTATTAVPGVTSTTTQSWIDAMHVSSTGTGSNAISATCNQSNASCLYAVATSGSVAVAAYSDTTHAGWGAVEAFNTSTGNGLAASSAAATSGSGFAAVYALNSSTGDAVYAKSGGPAVYAKTTGNTHAVYGESSTTSSTSGAVKADNTSSGIGLYATSSGSSGHAAVGIATGADAYGLYGVASASGGIGIYATGGLYAGVFGGTVNVIGDLNVGGFKSFLIDHPLDPENRTLRHFCVESPDAMNIYNGTGVLDEMGCARIELPAYFDALNKVFRYQLTALGCAAPGLYIAREISGNFFEIAGGAAGQRVSWQVTGVRQDAYAKTHQATVEEDKPETERGYYLNPEAFGQPATKGVCDLRQQKNRPS